MNYTENFHLPQWEKSDRILMDDFNQAMAGIDSGIASTARDAAQAASQAENAASALANKAQLTADTALSTAKAAQTSAGAAFRPGYFPYQTGSFVGTDGTPTTINLGFRPRFAIVACQKLDSPHGELLEVAAAGAGSDSTGSIVFTNTGMIISSLVAEPRLNMSGYSYSYIAFR